MQLIYINIFPAHSKIKCIKYIAFAYLFQRFANFFYLQIYLTYLHIYLTRLQIYLNLLQIYLNFTKKLIDGKATSYYAGVCSSVPRL